MEQIWQTKRESSIKAMTTAARMMKVVVKTASGIRRFCILATHGITHRVHTDDSGHVLGDWAPI